MRAHFLAFKALLEYQPDLSGHVFSNVRLSAGKPVRDNYVVLFPDGPADLVGRFTQAQSMVVRSRWRYDVRVVAVDAEGLLRLADAVAAVVGQVPVVAGRSCTPVRLVPGVEEGRGRFDSTTDLHYLDLSFEFWSESV